MPIENISDTARWVAVYRAMESERPDAHFHDLYARRLAGERGEQIVRTMPWGRSSAWAMIVRTAVFDELILRTIRRDGADTVLNLAAGLDTRAYRLELPPTLHWVDVDLADILRYKIDALANERPNCQYEPIALDLTNVSERRALFARVAAQAQRALVVTEGLLVYLTAAEVGTLGGDLHAQPTFRWWLIDIVSPALLQFMQRSWSKQMAEGKARFQFAPGEGPEFYRRQGWLPIEFRSSMEEAHRLRRESWVLRLWRILGRWGFADRLAEFRRTGTLLLERAPLAAELGAAARPA